MDKVKIALIGTGNRGTSIYLPIISKLKADLQLVAVCDPQEEAVKAQGEKYEAPAYTNTAKMLETARPDICAIVITPSNNHIVGLLCSEHGVSYCTETPIDTDLGWADRMIESASQHGIKLEVNENYYRVPSERIKREMIRSGVFGRVNVAYNEFRGHGYHGVGLIRSYVGFDNEPVRVFGFRKGYKVQEHVWRNGQPAHNTEDWQHGVIEFADGATGVFNFSSLSYGSPLRGFNGTKFYAECGMCFRDQAVILNDSADGQRPITITRKTNSVGGFETLAALIADTSPQVIWENPLQNYPLSDGEIPVASELMSIANAVRNHTEPEYGAYNGRKDREIDVAMSRSWSNDGQPVTFPFEYEKR
ncbi:MAG: Gfo/Idh/MocA family oxidoreductase [Candidatus Poribacteria bacterium]|nr:Gfo/Idh/MocA family oxidoreductase [Candidatus Poribacteria bacterium]